jgi:membrane protease YdiL (CAAX protease family)
MEKDFKNPSLIHAGALYSICACLFFFASTYLQKLGFYTGNLIVQFIVILLPPVLFLVLFKFDVKKVLRLNKIKLKTFFIIFFLITSAMPLVGVFNILNHLLAKTIFGKVQLFQIPVEDNLPSVLISFFIVGVAAGICEEVLFRGVIQRGLERYGIKKAIIITALLFGLMHLDFQRLFGTFLLGALIGFIVYRTNSLYGGIFAHFANNSIALLLTLFSLKAEEFLEGRGVSSGTDTDIFSQLENMPFENMPIDVSAVKLIGIIIGFLMVIVFFGAIFGFSMYLFIRNTSETKVDIVEEKEPIKPMDIVVFVPGLLIVIITYIIQGYGFIFSS